MNSRSFKLGRLAALISVGSFALVAQGVQTGDIQGVVKSASGKVVVGALVRFEAGRGTLSTTTNEKGEYRFLHQLVGATKLTVSASGYIGSGAQAWVNLGRTNDVNFTLKELTTSGATVEVIAAASSVDATEVTDGKNTSLEWVDSVPQNNRSIEGITQLSPGTAVDGNNEVTIRGAQGTQTQYMVDGVDVIDPVTGGAGVRMNEDMIEEIQVVSGGASADMGRFTGGMVNTVTKSGTNNWEGLTRLELTNPGVNALTPMAPRQPMTNGIQQNYVFSGPIIKDTLFFVVGYRNISPKNSTAESTTAPADWGGSQPYYETYTDERKDIKLDYIINANHRVSFQYNQTNQLYSGIDYADQFFKGSTSTASLSSQANTYSYQAFSYVGTLNSDLMVSARYGHKKESLGGPGSGGMGGTTPTYIDQTSQYVYGNGFFGTSPDSRPVENATLSLTWFGHGAGEHEVKFGGDWFQSSRNSANDQTPTDEIIFFNGFSQGPNVSPQGNTSVSNMVFAPGTNGSGAYLQLYVPFAGATSKNTVMSYYVNDKWKLNQHWGFNIGVRYDGFTSKNDIKASNFKFNTTTPRLTAIFDAAGDGKWVSELSYDVYAGQVLQGATDNASVVGNPAEYNYDYVGGNPSMRSSYAANSFSTINPQLYRNSNVIDSNIKMPVMKEVAYTLRHSDGNQGSYSMTISRREWSNFTTTYSSQQMNPADANDTVKNYIANDPSLTRHYFGVEFQFDKKLNAAFSYGGNVTLSTLRGNYDGGQTGSGGGPNAYGPLGTAVNPTPAKGTLPTYAYQPTANEISPYGALANDRPVAANVWSNYKMQVGAGNLNFGLLGIFASGYAYSLTATESLSGYPSFSPGAYGSTYPRYFSPRGAMRFPDTYHANLQVSYDFPIYRIVKGFTRLNITNVFNHQVQQTFNTSGSAYVADPTNPNNYIRDSWNSPNAKWMAGNSYGQAVSSNNYLAARALNLAFGVKF